MGRFILGFIILFVGQVINAQTYDYIQKKVDVNRQPFDVYGASVDVSGDFAVVGLPGDGEDEVVSGTVRHRIRVIADLAATDLDTGRRATLADPQDLWDRRTSLAQSGRSRNLTAGEARHIVFNLRRD
mgnify:CR=1 FL=1